MGRPSRCKSNKTKKPNINIGIVMDQAGRYTAEHTVMEAGMEIRELKHLLRIAEDNIEKLKTEIVRLKAEQKLQFLLHEDPTSMVLNFDEDRELELGSLASEKYNKFDDKSLLDSDDEEPNKESY